MTPLLKFLVLLIPLVGQVKPDESFSRNLAGFSIDLFLNTIPSLDQNVVISPFSVHTALGLTYMGATHETAEEMSTGLRLGTNDRTTAAKNFEDVLASYESHPCVKIANKIYVQEGLGLNQEFNSLAKASFNSEVEEIELHKSVEAAKTINTWVEEKTNHKIKDLLKPDNLAGDSRMVLLNAIYFLGKWRYKFPEEQTRSADFWITPDKAEEVEMMKVTSTFKHAYLPSIEAEVAELPYNGTDVSMLIILPRERDGLERTLELLRTADLQNSLTRMRWRNLHLELPKFEIEFRVSMQSALYKMNMTKMFGPTAEFGNMFETALPVSISDVIHKAYIKVDEAGTEAAAATAVVVAIRSGMSLPLYFNFVVNHPFLYIIKDSNGHILFIGTHVKS